MIYTRYIQFFLISILLTSCNFTDNMLGNGGDNTTGVETYGGFDQTAPNAPKLDSSIISILPSYTATGDCETNAVVTIKGDINPNPTSVTCVDGRYSADITFNAPEEKKVLNITQTDLAGNTSEALITQINYRSIAAISSLNSDGGKIVHANMSAYPMDGLCSHDGSNNVQITGGFAGSPVTVDCINEAWSYTADYSAVGDSMASESFDHCRRTSTMAYNDDSTLAYSFYSVTAAKHHPLIDFGDGSSEIETTPGVTTHVYSSASAPYTVQMKHCPSELETFHIANNTALGADSNLTYTIASIFPGGSLEYIELKDLTLYNTNIATAGFTDTPPSSNDFPKLVNYNLYGQQHTTGAIQSTIDCSLTPDLESYTFAFNGNHTPQLTGALPSMPATCSNLTHLNLERINVAGSFIPFTQLPNIEYYNYNTTSATGNPGSLPTSLIDFRIRLTGLTGSLPDPSIATNLSSYHADRLTNADSLTPLTHNFFINNSNLVSLYLFSGGGTGLSGDMPTISHMSNLTHYYVHDNDLNINPGNFPDPTNLSSLKVYYIYGNPITGGPYVFPDLTTLPSLTAWIVDDVDFTGSSIASNLTSLTNLGSFRVSNGNLTGVVPNISGLTSLQRFELGGNSLSGVAPGFAFAGSEISRISFYNNNLSQANINTLVDALYNTRASWTPTSGSSLFRVDGGSNASSSSDAIDKMNGTGTYIGDGLVQNGLPVLYNP